MPDVLRLAVTEFTDLTRWNWVLHDKSGTALAGQEVRLDPKDAWFEAFTDLQSYVSWQAAPDKRFAQEARIVTALGDWIGTNVFGPAIGNALLEHGPVIVEVILPEGAEALAYLPLEAARLQNRPLAANDITLVIRPPAASGPPPKPSGTVSTLRVLGLFSLPEGGNALNLRRERQSLVDLMSKIAAGGRAIEVKVLQYGVTRDRLRDVLRDGEGWDIIHVAGHGRPGELVLETAEGRPDRISAANLADLLEVVRDRVKLVTVSACWSAALATAEPRRLLGLPTPENQRHDSAERPVASPPDPAPTTGDIATTLATRLGCAVLAMRFPVGDEFAIEVAQQTYSRLIKNGASLPGAVTQTLRDFTDSGLARQFPALSMAATAIFGATAAELTLKAPPGTGTEPPAAENPKMVGFPPQPDRFIGRTGVMTRASAALAPASGIPGVILHGMPGGGKTACALELAYTHQDAFDQLIWFKAPDEGAAIDGSLTDFALALERALPDLEVIDKVMSEETLTPFLPALTGLMERNRLLVFIDNAESLLTNDGEWLDYQWGQVVRALQGHSGLGRLIMTTRRVPIGTASVQAGAVDALSANETLLLVRDLPHLRALISGKLDGLDEDTARNLANGVLNVAQGHPKLLELANGQAAHPAQLAALVQAGGRAWQEQGSLPGEFFADRETSATAEDYLHVLATWTNSVVDALSPGERDLFWLMCCLEEPDRLEVVISHCWPRLWRQLGHNSLPPRVHRVLPIITARGLATIGEGPNKATPQYTIHPGLAAAGRAQAGTGFQTAVDTEAAGLWRSMFQAGLEANVTKLLVRTGLAAIPYLTRQRQWTPALAMLDSAFAHEPSRANAAAALHLLQPIAAHTAEAADLLARVHMALNPTGAASQMQATMNAAVTRSDYHAATVAAGPLLDHYLRDGQLPEALKLADRQIRYTREAHLGPWTQLGDEVQRLQVLNAMGRYSEVLAEVQRLRTRTEALPDDSEDELTPPWEVRELLFDTGAYAASRLKQWQDALDLNSARADSLSARAASAIDIARTKFNNYQPLLRTDRIDDAFGLLLECQQTFQDSGEVREIGRTFSALSEIEGMRGHGDAAIRLERNALRYTYAAENVSDIAISYQNLGNYLDLHLNQPTRALPCHLMTALIHRFIGIESEETGMPEAMHDVVIDMRPIGGATETPSSIAELCRALDDIPGTAPSGLIAELCPDRDTADRTLRDLVDMGRWLVRMVQARDSR